MKLKASSTIFISALLTITSCETERTVQSIEEFNKSYLRINLEQNIKSVIPSSNGNMSEKFLYRQLYEPLFEHNHQKKAIPVLVDHLFLDSTINTYSFSLKKNHRFSDGKTLTTEHIRQCFERLFSNVSANENIDLLKKNIVGYGHKASNKPNDDPTSIPYGIKFIDDLTFTLITVTMDNQILNKLTGEEFCIYKGLPSGDKLGTGPFQIDNSNEDIKFDLKRNPYYGLKLKDNAISGINIRFIKNKNTLSDEFLNGSIDLIFYSSYNKKISGLEQVSSQKYGLKKKIEQDSATLQYFTCYNFTDLTELDIFSESLRLDSSLRINSNPISLEHPQDSLTYSHVLPIVNNTRHNYTEWISNANTQLDGKMRLFSKERSGINPNEKYIVINESRLKMAMDKPDQNTLKLLFNKSQENVSTLMVLSYQHDLIIFNENLNGFTKYGNWSKDVKKLTFSKPKLY